MRSPSNIGPRYSINSYLERPRSYMKIIQKHTLCVAYTGFVNLYKYLPSACTNLTAVGFNLFCFNTLCSQWFVLGKMNTWHLYKDMNNVSSMGILIVIHYHQRILHIIQIQVCMPRIHIVRVEIHKTVLGICNYFLYNRHCNTSLKQLSLFSHTTIFITASEVTIQKNLH